MASRVPFSENSQDAGVVVIALFLPENRKVSQTFVPKVILVQNKTLLKNNEIINVKTLSTTGTHCSLFDFEKVKVDRW